MNKNIKNNSFLITGGTGSFGKAFVSKLRTDTLMLQANAWYGSSGAVVFDKQGKVCGTVTGILVGHGPIVPQGLENYVFVSRVSFLTKDRIQEILGGGRN